MPDTADREALIEDICALATELMGELTPWQGQTPGVRACCTRLTMCLARLATLEMEATDA